MLAPGFWDDQRSARRLAREAEGLREEITRWQQLTTAARDLGELFELAESEGDQGLQDEVAAKAALLEGDFEKARTSLLFSGEYADADAIVTLQAGAGGTEACDWTAILLRAYMRWAERHSFATEIVDSTEGEGAGYRSVVLEIRGRNAFGWLRAERGVHRLVRISPFDGQKRRQTTFAMFEVIPEVEDDAEVTLNWDEIRVDTYRSSGAGGQHACLVADALGMRQVFVHPLAGVLSAYGMGLADQSLIREQTVELRLTSDSMISLQAPLKNLAENARNALSSQVGSGAVEVLERVHVRYEGSDTALMVPMGSLAEIVQNFEAAYRQRFAFLMAGKALMVETVSAKAK